MKTILSVLWTVFKNLFAVVTVLFVVYFRNPDQKLMGWVYTQARRIHDRKQTDIQF